MSASIAEAVERATMRCFHPDADVHSRERLRGKLAALAFAVVMTLLIGGVMPLATAQVCNPVIDGTHCAEQMSRTPTQARSSPAPTGAVRSIGGDLNISRDQPATLGAITFRGGERCVSSLFRSRCS